MLDDIQKLILEIDKMYNQKILKNKLSKFKIHNFRNFFKESQINFTFPLTVIVGKNGSGKTTLMKMIKLLSKKQIPQNEFFETVLDNGGLEGANISYWIDTEQIQYKRIHLNEWEKKGNVPDKFKVTYIQTKSMIGATDKSLLYNNIGKNSKRIQQIEYLIKQTKKIKQNQLSNSERKQRHYLEKSAIEIINWILQEDIQSIEIIRHKYYYGTWGTSVIFNNGKQYSEYNAGSGEFVITNIIDEIHHISENSLLLLDEPEVSLHPGAQKRLMCYILETIKKKKVQVIITTHSTTIVDSLPKSSIKCLRKMDNGIITIEEQILYQNAFIELESDVNKKNIIVEDAIAKKIIDGVLKSEQLDGLLQVNFYPGGADNIKKYTILIYSKTKIHNRYVIFDGDQKKGNIPIFSQVPDSDKDKQYYKNVFKSVVGISTDKIDWGIDANRKSGRYNIAQEQELIITYLEYFRNYVFFLPQMIPEDIIYDIDVIKKILDEDIPDFSAEKNSKEKLKKIADKTKMEITTIENMLIYHFIKRKNSDYKNIVDFLNKIIEWR
ncbi:ATP-dependent nuclease [Fusobacterium hwasookii]|uniref:ATPase n=1 Tax=Fusobacterium hwasookii ChDC F128 TaxID=1216362 RepID=A0ABP2R606_9FUSO|nr:AAA family ATPase [Fusobacterium hwasookii]EJU08394.1 ATPase [Fusobacterium hwasookii ChDC F128]